jgi:nucleotide-binding universal stress UspA family protein
MKHIMVHADDDAHFDKRLRYGLDLATRLGASLQAVFARTPAALPPALEGGFVADFMDAQNAYNDKAESGARALFDAAVMGAKIATEWTVDSGPRSAVLARRSREADLAIVGQPDPNETAGAADYDLPADLLMESGRPVLVHPYAGNFDADVKSALVAWYPGREASRAVYDALPLLLGVEVHVLSINMPAGKQATDASANDIAKWLGRHGIEADSDDIHTDELSASDMLLSRASDLGAKLIVMGGYSHSRFREMILGGVTHDILKHMTAPVLMSH